jgi:hypothetical protein
VISEEDIDRLASAARLLAPSASTYLEEDFVMNLLETVLDYMLQTEVVVKALERFREHRWDEVRRLDDLSDQDVIELTTQAARRIGIKAFDLDWRIWEASRGGALA